MQASLGIALFSLLGLFYIYAGYPLLLALWAKGRPRPVRKSPAAEALGVSVVMAVYNEEARLADKLRSLLAAAEGLKVLEILVGSDGSTDGGGRVVAAMAASSPVPVVWVPFPERRGKPSVLNELVPRCRGDIVVFTDARQALAPGALRALLRNFAEDEVGVVSGELVFADAGGRSAERSMGFYWNYEKFIRRREALVGSVPGATGALYAMRRALFRPIAPDTLLDDVALPMGAVVQGCRCVFEPEARVYDQPSQSHRQENIRKRRTIAGCAQLFAAHPEWALPWRNPIALQWVSHKLLRLVSPLLLALLFGATLPLIRSPAGAALAAGQGLLYGGALLGRLLERGGRASRLLAVPRLFVELNVVTVQALGDALRGRYRAAWTRAYAPRSSPPESFARDC